MKSIKRRAFGALLLAACCLGAMETWARLPKPIRASGVVLFVDLDTSSLVFKPAKNKKPFVLDWNKDTEFMKVGQPAAATALTNGTPVVIHYQDVSFHNPLLKKVVWEVNADVK